MNTTELQSYTCLVQCT